ncbi:MAG: response regulator [Gemmatimonadetes bacterium]|nr:response regulator [Gemmatimonadota bacterium]
MSAVGRRILVVEDDEETLNILSRTLAAGGHDVFWARNAPDALKLLARRDPPIALIITDVVLPGTSGPELVEQIREFHPDVAAIYVSAYDTDTVRSHGVDPNTMAFLPKPTEPRDLLRFVEAALGQG